MSFLNKQTNILIQRGGQTRQKRVLLQCKHRSVLVNNMKLKANKTFINSIFETNDSFGIIEKNIKNGFIKKDIILQQSLLNGNFKLDSEKAYFMTDSVIIPNQERNFLEKNIFSKSMIVISVKISGVNWNNIKSRDRSKKLKFLSKCILSNIKNKFDITPSFIVASSGYLHIGFAHKRVVIKNNQNVIYFYKNIKKYLYTIVKDSIEGIEFIDGVSLYTERYNYLSDIMPIPGLCDEYGFKVLLLENKLKNKLKTINELSNSITSSYNFYIKTLNANNLNPHKYMSSKKSDLFSGDFVIGLSNNRIRGIVSYIKRCKYNKVLSLKTFNIYASIAWICANAGMNKAEAYEFIKINIEKFMGRYVLSKPKALECIDDGWSFFVDGKNKLKNSSLIDFLKMSDDDVACNSYFRSEDEIKNERKRNNNKRRMLSESGFLTKTRTPEQHAFLVAICDISTLSIEDTCKKSFNTDRSSYYRSKSILENKNSPIHFETVQAYNIISSRIQKLLDNKERMNSYGNLSQYGKIEFVMNAEAVLNVNCTVSECFKFVFTAGIKDEYNIRQKEKNYNTPMSPYEKRCFNEKFNIQIGLDSKMLECINFVQKNIQPRVFNNSRVLDIERSPFYTQIMSIKEKYTKILYSPSWDIYYKSIDTLSMSKNEYKVYSSNNLYVTSYNNAQVIADIGVPVKAFSGTTRKKYHNYTLPDITNNFNGNKCYKIKNVA